MGGYPLPQFFKSHEGSSRAIEKLCDEPVDLLRHAGLGQRRADKAPRALKFYVLGKRHGRGDSLGLARGLGDGVVEGIGRVETREG